MAHYFDPEPATAHQIAEWQVRLHGHDFHFLTDSSVFSRRRLDSGSELLIDTVARMPEKPVGRLLDLGCGYGPIGIVLKRLFPALEVVLADINARALDLARQNARLNQVHYLEFRQSDGMQAVGGSFDLILLNPPVRAGKAVVYRLFAESAARLRPGGRLLVVIQKKQGAPSALGRLQEIFGSAEVAERRAGYWVLRATFFSAPE